MMTAAAAAAKAKKRGRPRKKREGDGLHRSPPSPPQASTGPRRTLRLRRRRPLLHDFADFDDYLDEEEEQQETRGKRRKLKLILGSPPLVPTSPGRQREGTPRRAAPVAPGLSSPSPSLVSFSHVDDDGAEQNEEDAEVEAIKSLKKPQFAGCDDSTDLGGSGDAEVECTVQTGKKNLLQRLKGSVSGVSTSSQAVRTPLPERTLLEAILDKIQKKDTYGVFLEPVDPKELPDYYDVIEHPMDFGTIRQKLASKAYHSFEQFEDDVFLICSNAMQYNAPDTIYFRQARSMQDMGRKEFQKLKTEGKCIEIDSKCEEKIGFNSTEKKPLQNCLPMVVQEPLVSNISFATTRASGEEGACVGLSTTGASGVEPVNTSYGHAYGGSSLGECKSEKVVDLNAKDSPAKLGRKLLEIDENRRATYNICAEEPAVESDLAYDVLEGEQRHLVAVGLDAEYSYARSLARFAVNLGPIAWRIASQRIGSALPSAVKFGPGWVGEYETPLAPIFFVENHPKTQQQQPVTRMALQLKMPLKKDKVSTLERKASGNVDSKEAQYSSQLGTRIHNRGSVPVEEGNGFCAVTEEKQKSSSVTSDMQLTDVTKMQLQNKQVNLSFAKASGNALKQIQECQPANQSLKGPEICNGVATSKSPGIISLDRKPMQPESLKQMEAAATCSTTDGLRVNTGQLSNGKVLVSASSNSFDKTMGVISKHQKGVAGDCWTLGSHEHGPGDPSRFMGLPIKTFDQSNNSSNSVGSSKLFQSVVPSTGREGSNTAAAAAARAWMSIGSSSQSKLSVDAMRVHASTSFCGTSLRTPNSSSRTSNDPDTISTSQSFRQSIQVVSLEPQVCKEGLVIFPQLAATDLSSLQGQIPWQGLAPQTENKHYKNICPPDLNISFQPPGSPVRHSPGILKDSQQPDLALQL